MDWSKSRKADPKPSSDKEVVVDASSNGNDTKHFVTEMESKLTDFDARLKQRRQDLAIAQAEIYELERLINAATQAISAAKPDGKPTAISMSGNKSAPPTAAE